MRVLDLDLEPGVQYRLNIEYELARATVSFENGGARLAFFMTDLVERGYLEFIVVQSGSALAHFDKLKG